MIHFRAHRVHLTETLGVEREKGCQVSRGNIIAIVDDDPSVRIATASLLRSFGLETTTFSSAEAFLAFIETQPIGCLVSDIQMDGISGMELSQILHDRGDTTPVILMTAYPDQRIRDRAMEAGAVAFLGKPFEGKDLIACIEQALAA